MGKKSAETYEYDDSARQDFWCYEINAEDSIYANLS